jgi:hypothetical protein
MNSPIKVFTVPAELKSLAEPSCFLPGESLVEYETIRRMIVEDIRPTTNLEWLWTLDLTELSWEILRYRRLRKAYRTKAVAAILQRLDEREYHHKAIARCKSIVSKPRTIGAMIRMRRQR